MIALPDLGPNTEALLSKAFADSLFLTAARTAALLGIDVRTLRAMTDDGLIRAVRRGKVRGYIERDVRAYLAEGPDQCGKPPPKRQSVPGAKVIAFSARRGARPHDRL